MCWKGDWKVPQRSNKAAMFCASGREGNAISTAENWQKEECVTDDGQAKFGFSDERSGPRRILQQKPAKEEVCLTPVKEVCNLGHRELEPLSGVSQAFKKAVKVAKDADIYKTPVHVRQRNRSLLLNKNPENSAAGSDSPSRWPPTRKAPREVKKRNVLLTDKDLSELSRVLFSEGNKPFTLDVVDTEHTILFEASDFAYKTPDHGRRRNRSVFLNESPANSAAVSDRPSRWPATPNAPKRVVKQRNFLLSDKDMEELNRVLFPDGDKPSSLLDVVEAKHTILFEAVDFAYKTPDHGRRRNPRVFSDESPANSAALCDSPCRWPATPRHQNV